MWIRVDKTLWWRAAMTRWFRGIGRNTLRIRWIILTFCGLSWRWSKWNFSGRFVDVQNICFTQRNLLLSYDRSNSTSSVWVNWARRSLDFWSSSVSSWVSALTAGASREAGRNFLPSLNNSRESDEIFSALPQKLVSISLVVLVITWWWNQRGWPLTLIFSKSILKVIWIIWKTLLDPLDSIRSVIIIIAITEIASATWIWFATKFLCRIIVRVRIVPTGAGHIALLLVFGNRR